MPAVMRATKCGSTFCFQSSLPSCALIAKTLAWPSPTNAAYFAAPAPVTGPTVMAFLMIDPVSNDQYTQPVFASSEYTKPLSLPTNTRPDATVGCALADTPDGKPNAHLSFSFGT